MHPLLSRRRLQGLPLLLVTSLASTWPGGQALASPPAPTPSRAETRPAAPVECAAAQAKIGAQAKRLLVAAPRLQALLLGEIHTSAADHAWQLASLEALAQQGRPLLLGLEMVPAARQAALDRYSSGQLDEAAFLEQVGWAEVWGHDPDLYLPLLRWARLRRVPLLALNAEPELVRRVRRKGLAALPAAERPGIGLPAPAGGAYRQRLEAAWRAHGGALQPQTAAAANDLDHFIDSQLLRDRAMAEAIATAQRRDPRRLVVALVGQGHLGVADGASDGVPRQLQALGLNAVLSLRRVALPEGCGPAPVGARLGAYLESEAGAVWVRRVAPGSAAAAAGLRPGDRILEVNGTAVDHAGQVIRRVRQHPQGEPLRLTIEWGGQRRRLELSLPARNDPQQASRDNGDPAPHPVLRSALRPT